MSYDIDNILYATGLGPRGPEVFRHAVGIAQRFGAKLHVITVAQLREQPLVTDFISHEEWDRNHDESVERLRTALQERIEAFCATHPDLDARSVIASVQVLEGNVSRAILATAKRIGADLIVLGSHGHSPLGELLIGSAAHKVTVESDVPVLLVPINH
jgi:nucleotide-binding universal stress UspA family protein